MELKQNKTEDSMESEDRQSAFDRRNEKCDHVVFRLISVSWEDLTGIYKIKNIYNKKSGFL